MKYLALALFVLSCCVVPWVMAWTINEAKHWWSRVLALVGMAIGLYVIIAVTKGVP